jgi:hypothetical protein
MSKEQIMAISSWHSGAVERYLQAHKGTVVNVTSQMGLT